jgi:hypothetical protein
MEAVAVVVEVEVAESAVAVPEAGLTLTSSPPQPLRANKSSADAQMALISRKGHSRGHKQIWLVGAKPMPGTKWSLRSTLYSVT